MGFQPMRVTTKISQRKNLMKKKYTSLKKKEKNKKN